MNKERLLRLADLLESDAANKDGIYFNLSEWGTITNPDKPLSCGTSACAMGLAAISGIFKEEGLSYRLYNKDIVEIFYKGRGADGYYTAQNLFDLQTNDVTWLFSSYSYDHRLGPRQAELAVAKRIRDFCERKTS